MFERTEPAPDRRRLHLEHLGGLIVHGERLDLLLSGLLRFRPVDAEPGTAVRSARMADAEAAAIARAALRIEAELALRDAETLSDSTEVRTSPERRLRAMTLLAQRVASAMAEASATAQSAGDASNASNGSTGTRRAITKVAQTRAAPADVATARAS